MEAVASSCSHNFIDKVVDDFVTNVAAITDVTTAVSSATLTVLSCHLISWKQIPIIARNLTYEVR